MKLIASLLLSVTSLVTQTLTNDNGWRPAWGLDRIDQRSGVLDDKYNYAPTGAGVTVYVFDSGINSAHEEFGGRVVEGFSVINDGKGTQDCSGHGTHTSSVIGGKTYGVAKSVTIVPVRVLNCSNGNPSSATLYPAIKWIIEHHQQGVPAIVNVSVGMPKSVPFDEAMRALIADGLIVIGAAGNQGKDACGYSPARELSVITVGATDMKDSRPTYSNFGSCIDLFAPGSDVVGGWFSANNAYRSTTGTSNAAPLVSGIAALLLQENPSMTQPEVEAKLKSMATRDVLTNIGTNSPNLMAYSLTNG